MKSGRSGEVGDEFFARAAQWLLALGVASGVLAMIPGAADFVTIERARRSTAGIAHAAANGAVILLALGDTVIRALGDPVGVVGPWGITLSAATALLLAVSGWFGGELSYRYLVGVDPKEALARRRGERLE